MAVSANLYANVYDQAFQKKIDLVNDSIKMALLTSSYTPNLGTDAFWSAVSANEASGTGYTTGGIALASKTHTVTAANSWGTAWAATTVYSVGAIVRPASGNGFLYLCIVGGTSGGSAPTFPTSQGQTVVDSGVTWTCIGESIFQFSSAAVTWSSSTITAQYAVIYDAQSGTASTEPLIAVVNFGGNQSSSNGNFTVTPATNGWFWTTPA